MEKLLCFAQITALVLLSFMMQVQGNVDYVDENGPWSDDSKCLYLKQDSAILPNLTYCHIVWPFCKASDARKLERLQERALRAVYNDRNATYEELLEKGRLSSLVKTVKRYTDFNHKKKNKI